MGSLFKSLPDARTLAEQIKQGQYARAQAQAVLVEGAITQASKHGKREATIGESLEESVKIELENKGFKITFTSEQREGSYTRITW